ncbi:MAG: hypothetical protein ACJ79A_17845 [Gemmatimonadaceae bacterium]
MTARTVPVRAVGSIAPDVLAHAESELAHQHTLADVLAWARGQSPPRAVTEIVTQDEYTHDVVIPFDGSHFLAFDAT